MYNTLYAIPGIQYDKILRKLAQSHLFLTEKLHWDGTVHTILVKNENFLHGSYCSLKLFCHAKQVCGTTAGDNKKRSTQWMVYAEGGTLNCIPFYKDG